MDATTRGDVTRADLCRVTVVAPRARIDVALPVDVPLAELVPTLLRRSGTDPLTDGGAHGAGGAWGLQRFGDRLLDGEVLHLRPHRSRLPEPDYDDVADAVAGAVTGRTPRWTPDDTRRAASAAGAAVLLVAAVLVLRGGPPWSPVAVAAGAVAVVLLVTATALSRAFGDARAGLVAAVAAVGAAALAGATGLAGPGASGWLGAPSVLGACSAALVVAVLAALGRVS